MAVMTISDIERIYDDAKNAPKPKRTQELTKYLSKVEEMFEESMVCHLAARSHSYDVDVPSDRVVDVDPILEVDFNTESVTEGLVLSKVANLT